MKLSPLVWIPIIGILFALKYGCFAWLNPYYQRYQNFCFFLLILYFIFRKIL